MKIFADNFHERIKPPFEQGKMIHGINFGVLIEFDKKWRINNEY